MNLETPIIRHQHRAANQIKCAAADKLLLDRVPLLKDGKLIELHKEEKAKAILL